jgi:16S rRNA (adenine1518-N6/adenine1519-N6)-dimethyltransferase
MSRADNPRLLLRELEQAARRRFGQHFLKRQDIVDRMVRGAGIESGDSVVEIGPGLGILTEAILRAGGDLTAVELDRDLAAYIRATYPAVRLIEADAGRVNWDELLGDTVPKVVANLPYNVGTTIVMQMLRRTGRFHSITVMLQKEVVSRMLARPGTKSYGALSLHLNARATPVFLFDVPPNAFHPAPKVVSSVIRLVLRPQPVVGSVDPAFFDKVVMAGFAHRRKTIANSLKGLFGRDRALAALGRAGIDPGVRGEKLDLSGFIGLAEALAEDAEID